MADPLIGLLVPREHVKEIKTCLEQQGYYNHKIKIAPEIVHARDGQSEPSRMVITTSISPTEAESEDDRDLRDVKRNILSKIGCAPLDDIIGIYISTPLREADGTKPFESKNAVIKTLYIALSRLPMSLLDVMSLTPAILASTMPESYSVYKPLLLLPAHAFISPPWAKLLARYPAESPTLARVWKAVAASVGATHVAINASIPLQKGNPADGITNENILRSPTNITPIYGNFGGTPSKTRMEAPSLDDFEQAFWVSTTQNNIHQVWAPLYTMFSRGNIREKTRILTHTTVLSAAYSRSAMVDLYAGIGYFAFSYARAGLRPVLCWELNPWSIEGLRRGAALNGWSTHIYTSGSLPHLDSSDQAIQEWAASVPDTDFLIFQQSNEHASSIIPLLTSPASSTASNTSTARNFAPIRHINLGLLPSSTLSWPTAIRIISPQLGGWLHVHENVGVNEIVQKTGEIECALQKLLDSGDVKRTEGRKGKRKVRIEHVERVKTFAPGVVHVVLDCWVDGEATSSRGYSEPGVGM